MQTIGTFLFVSFLAICSISGSAQKCNVSFLPHYFTYQDSTYYFHDTLRFEIKGKPVTKTLGTVGGIKFGVTFEQNSISWGDADKPGQQEFYDGILTRFFVMRGSEREYIKFYPFQTTVSKDKKEELSGGNEASDYKQNHKKNAVKFAVSAYKN